MKLAENLWLGSVAAQQNLLHMVNYSTAFYGAAALQGAHLGLTAPVTFWSALSRVGHGAIPANLDVTPPAPADAPKAEASKPQPAEAAPIAAEPDVVPDTKPVTASPHLLDAPRGGKADDLTVISGIGPKLAETLGEFGIYHYDQIASLDTVGIDWLNEQQPGFKALLARFDMVGQAKVLATG
jgi:predicted flap endonuclease-1-like 5' DNA nuclease